MNQEHKEKYVTCEKKHIRNKELAPTCPLCVGKIKRSESKLIKIPIKSNVTSPIITPPVLEALEEFKKTIPLHHLGVKKARKHEDILDRARVIKTLKEQYQMSFVKIGKLLNYCDHTAVSHLYKKYARLL